MSTVKADLLVVGAGTAGLPLAIEAASRGLTTMLVEQSDRIGGTLWQSWGQLSAAGTQLQAKRGITDTSDLHFQDVMRISKGTADPILVRKAVELAADSVDWLMSNGFDMDPDAPAILHFHEPYQIARTYWGRQAGRSVLNVMAPLLQKQIDKGLVTLKLRTEMLRLNVEGNQVVSTTVRTASGGTIDIEADAVVLTTGGFAGNPDLFRKLTEGAPLIGPGSQTSQGTGIMAAHAVGAQIRGQNLFLPTYGGVLRADSDHEAIALDDYPVLTPQSRQPWEIHVNSRGERFVAEDAKSVDERENALLQQPDLTFWVVYDEYARTQSPPLFPSWTSTGLDEAFRSHPSFTRAATIGELAREAAIDPDGLKATVISYNESVKSGKDSWGRRHLPMDISSAPFYAVKNHGTTLKSPAGLVVNEDLRVCGLNGTPFGNLYAAGEALGGSTLSGKSFVSGMSVTPAISFGRMLARNISSNININVK